MQSLAEKCRLIAAYHGNVYLTAYVQQMESVIQAQRDALIEAADRIEQLEAQAARSPDCPLPCSHATTDAGTQAAQAANVETR